MATVQTITVYRGEQVVLNFTMSPVVNISGWTLPFTVAKKSNSPTKLIQVNGVILAGPSGTFSVTLTEENTDQTPDTYYFDVWRNDEGYEQVLAIGSFVVLPTARLPLV